MLTLCWAAKGGSGTSVVAASMAVAADSPSLLIDLAGDAPTLLGLAKPDTPGIFDWFASDAPTHRLAALETSIGQNTSLIHRGSPQAVSVARWQLASSVWANDERRVIVDLGTRPPLRFLGGGCSSLLVTRPCYLATRAAAQIGIQPTGIVMVREPGRLLRARDLEVAIGAPVVAVIEWDPAIARVADSGLLANRLPGGLRRELRRALHSELRDVA